MIIRFFLSNLHRHVGSREAKGMILPEAPLRVRIIGLSPADAKAAPLNRYLALTGAKSKGLSDA